MSADPENLPDITALPHWVSLATLLAERDELQRRIDAACALCAGADDLDLALHPQAVVARIHAVLNGRNPDA